MGRSLLTEAEFRRVMLSRVKQERPDLRVRPVGKSLLMVENVPGHQRILSVADVYQAYCDYPADRDEMIEAFLSSVVYNDPEEVRGNFEENARKVMPQVVPPSLLDYCRRDRRDLAAVQYVGGLAIAFVVDEPERYAYIALRKMEEWGVPESALLRAAVQNLKAAHEKSEPHHIIGEGLRTTVVWETFDGYDASRILLTRELNEMAAYVMGSPVVAIPHRDYLIMFGDADPDFLAEMQEKVQADFEGHPYPITPRLFTLRDGMLTVYEGPGRQARILN